MLSPHREALDQNAELEDLLRRFVYVARRLLDGLPIRLGDLETLTLDTERIVPDVRERSISSEEAREIRERSIHFQTVSASQGKGGRA